MSISLVTEPLFNGNLFVRVLRTSRRVILTATPELLHGLVEALHQALPDWYQQQKQQLCVQVDHARMGHSFQMTAGSGRCSSLCSL